MFCQNMKTLLPDQQILELRILPYAQPCVPIYQLGALSTEPVLFTDSMCHWDHGAPEWDQRFSELAMVNYYCWFSCESNSLAQRADVLPKLLWLMD